MTGITGSSMSGLARLLLDMGFQVSGSCDRSSAVIDSLRALGITVTIGHTAETVHQADLVIYTTAVSSDNPELLECERCGIPVMDRPELLGWIAERYERSVAICGTHGKTTSTSMLAKIMLDNGEDAAIHIGGVLDAIGGSVRLGHGDLFITEACEYKRAFFHLKPYLEVILNIDRDHLDCYRDIEEIETTFGTFMDQVKEGGILIGNGSDARILHQFQLRPDLNHLTFGWNETDDYHPRCYQEDAEEYVSFDFYCHEQKLCHVQMAVPGKFNAENALAALAAAHVLGADMISAATSLSEFSGAHRRFERTAVINGVELFHDYGHNPTEIRNALHIARKRCKGKLISVVQPHTFSRLRSLFDDFVTCTAEADLTLITDVFMARERDPGDLDSGMLADAMNRAGISARWTPTFEDAEQAVLEVWKPGDLVITQGCGNIYLLNDMIARHAQSTGLIQK